jgi:hypothetical protein
VALKSGLVGSNNAEHLLLSKLNEVGHNEWRTKICAKSST